MLENAHSLSDTIVACATGAGEGAIAIVRLSGPRARAVASVLTGSQRPRESHRLVRARLRDAANRALDDAMVVEMHAPHSYTGEDVVELHLHGSRAVVQAVIERCQALGARLAEPGEFTLRAFVNGRLDLAQAEAVADLVASSNEAQRAVAADHLAGGLSRVITGLLEALERVAADWRAEIDFPEQIGERGVTEGHFRTITDCKCRIQQLIKNARIELRSGRRIVLCGAPNAGKSTLLNAWAGEDRVLVDPSPGTTRDPVEVQMGEGLVRWSVWDTAGIRDHADGIEARGIAMAVEQAHRADVALWLVAADNPQWPPAGLRVLVVGSKSDLAWPNEQQRIAAQAEARGHEFLGWVSAQEGTGVEALRRRVAGLAEAPIDPGVAVVVRERHLEALKKAEAALGQTLEARAAGLPLDVLVMELEGSVRALGHILGRDVDAAILDRIFSEFCLGK